MAEAFGVRYNPHVWGTGIAIAASLQLLAVLPSHTPTSLAPLEPMLEFDRTEHPIRQAILTEPIEHARASCGCPMARALASRSIARRWRGLRRRPNRNVCNAGKRLQQPDADIRDRAGEESNAGDHHQDAHGALDIDEMALHAREQRRELLDHEGRDQEGNAEAGGIDREQARALRHRRFRRGHRQDRGEDRADAGRPAEGEGEPHHIGAPQADRLGRGQAPLAHQTGRSASGRGSAGP